MGIGKAFLLSRCTVSSTTNGQLLVVYWLHYPFSNSRRSRIQVHGMQRSRRECPTRSQEDTSTIHPLVLEDSPMIPCFHPLVVFQLFLWQSWLKSARICLIIYNLLSLFWEKAGPMALATRTRNSCRRIIHLFLSGTLSTDCVMTVLPCEICIVLNLREDVIFRSRHSHAKATIA